MILLFSSDSRSLATLRQGLPGTLKSVVAFTVNWSDVERAPATHQCSVVSIDWLASSPLLPRLAGFKARYPQHPVVLVTRFHPENARQLKDLALEEVVWLREAERELGPAVQRICTQGHDYPRCLAVPFQEAEHLPPAVRAALAYACRAQPPVRSVNQLAAAVGCDRRTLWLHWKQAVSPKSELRLQDVLHWVLLLRAVGRKTPDRPWAAVAGDIGVSPDTLGRWAKCLAGATLEELVAGERVEAIPRFQEHVCNVLLREK